MTDDVQAVADEPGEDVALDRDRFAGRYQLEHGALEHVPAQPGERVLDIGCGIGRMARPLTPYLTPPGAYDGFDINADGIAQLQAGADWLTQHKVLSGKINIADHAVKL